MVVRWMNLEPLMHSEESQKEKNKYINAHIQSLNNSTDELFTEKKCRCRRREQTGGHRGRKERGGQIEKVALTYTHYHV